MAFFRFGPYRLEVATRRLLCDGESIPLTPKAFDILVALIERRERVVDKAELMQLVWPDSFVEEANLTQTIFVLRKTLGADAGGSHYIETVPRRGYRFAAAVREPVPAAADAGGPPRPDRRTWLLAGGVAAVVVAVIAIGTWRYLRAATDSQLVSPTRLVVLPFENLTANREDGWLSNAFSDSLTSGLRDVDNLVLVSRDRIVELYRMERLEAAAAVDAGVLRRVATALGVRYVVHGSYQRVGDDLKVTARLIDADSGAIAAQESVTAAFNTLLAIEDDLAGSLATQLQVRRREAAAAETTSLEAYRDVVEGRTMYAESRFADALTPLTRATTLDPRYAEAWALLAKVHARRATITMLASGAADGLRRDARQAAERAVALRPSSYEAHLALALAHREMEDFEPWREAARTAIALNPRIAEAHELLADSYFAGNAWGCRRDRDARLAEESFRTAIALDPRFPAAHANFSYHFSWLARDADALRVADDGLAVLPGNAIVTRARALALIRLKRVDDADTALRSMIAAGAAMSAQDHLMFGMLALARGNLALGVQEFNTAAARLPASAFQVAIARAFFDNGKMAEGMTYLDRAAAIEPSCAQFAMTSPAFAAYRAHLHRKP